MQLPIVTLPCEHFPVAQDALNRSRCPRGTYSFDHLIDRAADACNSDVGHGHKHAPVRHAPLAARMSVMPPVSQANVREPFSPLWPPLPCSQKRPASVLPAPTDRHSKSPTAKAWAGSLAVSRRQSAGSNFSLHSCTIDADGRLNFQIASQSIEEMCSIGSTPRKAFSPAN